MVHRGVARNKLGGGQNIFEGFAPPPQIDNKRDYWGRVKEVNYLIHCTVR